MTEHLSKNDIQRFRVRELTQVELLKLDGHLSGCDGCRDKLLDSTHVARAVSEVEAAFRSPDLANPIHLRFRELEGYVDNKLEPQARMTVENHIAICSECVSEIEELKALAAPVTVAVAVRNIDASSRATFIDTLRQWMLRPSLNFGIFAGIVICLVSAAWYWSLLSKPAGEPELAAIESSESRVAAVAADSPSISELVPGEEPGSSDILITGVETPSDPKTPPSETRYSVSLIENGRTVGLADNGELAGYDGLHRRHRELLLDSLRTEKIDVGRAAKDLRPSGSVTMGSGDESRLSFNLNGPVAKVLETRHPFFSWQALAGAKSYVVDVYDTNFNKVATSGKINSNTWRTSLAPGRTYLWQVTAEKDGKEIKAPKRPAPEARFTILDSRKSNEIQSLRRRYPNSPLLLGLLYAEAGLVDEAAREFERLLRKNPGSKLARSFLMQVRKNEKIGN